MQVFFVISGYLITQSIESRPGAPRQRILAFYGRRIRRILPPLYIYLLLVAPYIFLRYPVLIEGWLASFSFTYNFYHLLPKMVHSRLLTHTWSLGVEEQFYLVFPFLMVLWRRRATALLIAVVLGAPLIRWGFADLLARSEEERTLAVYVAGFTQLDAFAVGALLCLHRERLERFVSWAAIALMLAAMVALGWVATGTRDGAFWLPFLGAPGAAQYVWGYSLVALLAGPLVVRFSDVRRALGASALAGAARLLFLGGSISCTTSCASSRCASSRKRRHAISARPSSRSRSPCYCLSLSASTGSASRSWLCCAGNRGTIRYIERR